MTAIAPLIIEAAISPFRAEAPVKDDQALLGEARASIAAGASVIHFHHDTRLEPAESVAALIEFSRKLLADHPGVLLYPGILGGSSSREHAAHLEPMAEAGVLGLAPLDPGASVPYDLDADGFPRGHGYVWNNFSTAKAVTAAMRQRGVPLTIGVYEPVQLRWALAAEAAGKLPAGTMVKLYFGGRSSLFDLGRPALNFGLPPTTQALDMYLAMMAGSRLTWNVGIMGDSLMRSPLARYALERGGHLRVGIEDIAETTDETNAGTVTAAAALAAEVGRPVATPVQAAALLGIGAHG